MRFCVAVDSYPYLRKSYFLRYQEAPQIRYIVPGTDIVVRSDWFGRGICYDHDDRDRVDTEVRENVLFTNGTKIKRLGLWSSIGIGVLENVPFSVWEHVEELVLFIDRDSPSQEDEVKGFDKIREWQQDLGFSRFEVHPFLRHNADWERSWEEIGFGYVKEFARALQDLARKDMGSRTPTLIVGSFHPDQLP